MSTKSLVEVEKARIAVTMAGELAQKAKRSAWETVEGEALDRCGHTSKEEYGYGPATVWHFADGSLLIYDGRGYTADLPR